MYPPFSEKMLILSRTKIRMLGQMFSNNGLIMSMQACVVWVTIFSTGGKFPVALVQSYTLLLRRPFFILHLINLQHMHTQSHTQVQTILTTVSVAHLPWQEGTAPVGLPNLICLMKVTWCMNKECPRMSLSVCNLAIIGWQSFHCLNVNWNWRESICVE